MITRLIPTFSEFDEGPAFRGMKEGTDDGYGRSYVPYEEARRLENELDERLARLRENLAKPNNGL